MSYVTENAMKHYSEAFGRRLEGTGITRIQWIALYYVKTRERISQRNLSVLMKVQDSSSGRLIDRLERDGLIERERDNVDRRIIYIKLTDKGDKLITDLMPIGIKFNDDLMAGIDEKDIEIYEKVLQKMIYNVKEIK